MDSSTIIHTRPRCRSSVETLCMHVGPAVVDLASNHFNYAPVCHGAPDSSYHRNHDVNQDNEVLSHFCCTLSHFSTLFWHF